MENFLKQFLTQEELDNVKAKHKEKFPDFKGLPVHIAKTRLDEVIGERDTAKTSLIELQKKLDAVPEDWQAQLNAVPKDWKEQIATAQKEAKDAKTTADIAAKIYAAKGKNPTAIRALMDPAKDADKELTRIQTSDPYLFGESVTPPPKGTGKGDDGHGGEGDNKKDSLSENSMRAALGLPPIDAK